MKGRYKQIYKCKIKGIVNSNENFFSFFNRSRECIVLDRNGKVDKNPGIGAMLGDKIVYTGKLGIIHIYDMYSHENVFSLPYKFSRGFPIHYYNSICVFINSHNEISFINILTEEETYKGSFSYVCWFEDGAYNIEDDKLYKITFDDFNVIPSK